LLKIYASLFCFSEIYLQASGFPAHEVSVVPFVRPHPPIPIPRPSHDSAARACHAFGEPDDEFPAFQGVAMQWVERKDAWTSHLVDQAIFLDATAGAAVAWAFLMKRGVPEQIIERALTGKVRQIKKPEELIFNHDLSRNDAS
jgi:hypothetical protein